MVVIGLLFKEHLEDPPNNYHLHGPNNWKDSLDI